MSALFILITASLCIAGCALGAFLWSVKDGQMEDMEASGMRMVNDE